MKAIVIILMLCYVSLSSNGQIADTSNKNSSFAIRDLSKLPNRPLLYIIDGKQTIDSTNQVLAKIVPSEILEYMVLKDSIATVFYGKAGINGAIVIKTKNYNKTDTANKAGIFDSAIEKNALYVIDGNPSKNKLNGIAPNDILSIQILKKEKSLDPSLTPGNDAIIIVTRQGAILAYKRKFGAISSKYKEYLEKHQNNDEDFLYVLDGIPVQGKRDEIIETLYKIPVENIKAIGFNAKEPTDGSQTLVIINTKQ